MAEENVDAGIPAGKMTSNDIEDNFSNKATRGRCKLPWFYVEPVIFLYYLAMFANAPLQSQYIYSRMLQRHNMSDSDIPGNNTPSENMCEGDTNADYQQEAQTESSLFTMWLYLALMVPTLIVVIPLGAHSDHAGRKWAIIPPTVAEVLRLTLSCFVVYFELPLPFFILGSVVVGLSGSASLVLVGAYAYIADVTTKSNRAMRLTITEVLVGIANTVGQLTMGYFIRYLGFFFSYVIVAVIMFTTLIYVIFFLGESNKAKGPRIGISAENFTRPVTLFVKDNGTGRRPIMITVLLICAANTLIVHGPTEVTTLYFLNTPLCWSSEMIGIFNAYAWVIRGTTPVLWLALLRRRLTERGLVIMGAISAICYFIVLSQATQTWIVYLAPVGGIAMELTTSMARVTGSQNVNGKEQGAMFTSCSWVALLSVMFGVILFNSVYSATLEISHTFVFYLAAILGLFILLLAVMLFVIVRRRTNRSVITLEVTSPIEENGSQKDILHMTKF